MSSGAWGSSGDRVAWLGSLDLPASGGARFMSREDRGYGRVPVTWPKILGLLVKWVLGFEP